MEEETAVTAEQIESEEKFSEGATEEFAALSERADAEVKETKAARMMKESIGHGTHALGLLLHATITACLVVYVVVMRVILKKVVPSVATIWSRETPFCGANVIGRACSFILHSGFIIGTIASIPRLIGFEDIATVSKVKILLCLAVISSAIESFGMYSTYAVCCCHINEMSSGSIILTAIQAFTTNFVYLVPVVVMELLIVLTIFGPGVFSNQTYLFNTNPVLIWSVLLLLVCVFMQARVMKLRAVKAETNKLSDSEECDLLCKTERQQVTTFDIKREYGSIKNANLLFSSISPDSKSDSSDGCLRRASRAIIDYFDSLRISSDLLALTLMVVLVRHCWPLLSVLKPLAKTSVGMITTWVSMPILIVAALVLVVIIHFLFVR